MCGWYLVFLRRQALIVGLFVLALRVPFLNQAIQGDDVNYLYVAEHAQIDPLHPTHARYVFLGQTWDMRGHPHPPLNGWYLGLLLAIFKDISEIPFHAAYVPFSLIAAFSALALARRFSAHPLAATLLFLATPAFVVNGNSLEADLPLTAFWLLTLALFVTAVDRRSPRLLGASCLAMAIAALFAYQAVLMVPILLLYSRKWRVGWLAALTAPAVLVAWQLYERFTSGALPAGVFAGYMQSNGLQALDQKLKSAVALTGHLAWVVFPGFWLPPLVTIPVAIGAAFYDVNPLFWGSIAVGLGILIWCARNWRDFLAQWILIFFAAALAIFFAGAARYLLPIGLPIAILAARRAKPRWLEAGFGCSLALGIALAIVNYQHWDGYRRFARNMPARGEHRVWINGEWGLRYYLEADGGLPLMQGQAVHPGEIVVTSRLGLPLPFTTGGGVLTPIAEQMISSPVPVRIVSLHGRSGYSTTAFGLRPFDLSLAPIDQVRAELVVARKPTLSDLPMNAPEAGQQIVSGIYQLENGQWRWMSGTGVVLLKSQDEAAPVVIRFFIPNQAPARRVAVDLDGRRIASQTYAVPGSYALVSAAVKPEGDTAQVTITVDKTFSIPGDTRKLGVVLSEVKIGRE